MNDWAAPLLAIVLLLAVPTAFAGLLRWAGMTAGLAAITGGIIGGVLLGPLVLGRVRPELHERLFLGGVEEHRKLDHLLRRRGAEVLVEQSARLPPAERARADLAFEVDRLSALSALTAGRSRDQWWLRVLASVLAISMLAATAWDRRRPPVSALGIAVARWLACPLIAAALVRVDVAPIARLPLIMALVVQFLILLVVRPRDPRHATWACLAIMCAMAAWNLAGDLATVMLMLVALLTEAMDARAKAARTAQVEALSPSA